MDSKIVCIIRSLRESNVENQMKVASEKINTLERQLRDCECREEMYKKQTESLKNKNIQLIN